MLDAQVSVADFNLIRKNQDCFLSLCQLLDEKEQAASSFKNKVAVALTQREEELQHFTEERKLVLNFVNVCLALGKSKCSSHFACLLVFHRGVFVFSCSGGHKRPFK